MPLPHPAARGSAQLPCASPSEEQVSTNSVNQSSNVHWPEAAGFGWQGGLPAPAPPPHVHPLNPRHSSHQPRREHSLRVQGAVSPARRGYLGEGGTLNSHPLFHPGGPRGGSTHFAAEATRLREHQCETARLGSLPRRWRVAGTRGCLHKALDPPALLPGGPDFRPGG